MTEPRVTPRIEIENPLAGRLAAEQLPAVLPATKEGPGTLALAASGVGVLVAGLAGLSVGNFVVDQFARGAALGWATLGVAVTGGALIAGAVVRELGFLRRLSGVDRLRAELADPLTARAAARRWLRSVPGGEALLPAIEVTEDPQAIAALLRAGPGQALSQQAGALGRAAALQVLAVTAAVPSPSLDAVVVTLRGVRLVRQVACLYGLRPGTLGTVALLRRTLLSGMYVAGANVAVDTVVKAVVSNPALQTLAGDVAGAGVAARRMIVLARAAAAACSPLEQEGLLF